MKHYSILSILAGLCLLTHTTTALAQKTGETDIPRTISYQGMLTSNDGAPLADGLKNVTVTLYADPAGTIPLWQETQTTTITNGIFNLYLGSMQPLPSSAELNRPLWVGTAVDGQQEMRPLTPLSASPYALNLPDRAVTAGKLADGAVTADKVEMDYVKGFRVNGQEISAKGAILDIRGSDDIALRYDEATGSLQIGQAQSRTYDPEKKGASVLAGTATDQVWSGKGDIWDVSSGQPLEAQDTHWIGTSEHYNFNIRVNNLGIMRYQPNSGNTGNIVGGWSGNVMATSAIGSIIAAGGEYGFANEIEPNVDFSVIGGGKWQTLGSDFSVIGGGIENRVGSNAPYSIVGGGEENMTSAKWATVGGGHQDSAQGEASTVAGGEKNVAVGRWSAIGGGFRNRAIGLGSFIGGGGDTVYAVGNPFFNITEGIFSVVTGGYHDTASGSNAFVGGGDQNRAGGNWSSIVGGKKNKVQELGSAFSHIGGGENNQVGATESPAQWGTVGGGYTNRVRADYATIGGGDSNTATGEHATVGGGSLNNALADYTTVSGGVNNEITGMYSVIGGGIDNFIDGTKNTIGGGDGNTIEANNFNTIGGGGSNTIGNAGNATISGGLENSIADLANTATIGGGYQNRITSGGVLATIPGGNKLTAQSYVQTVLGVSNEPKGSISPGFTVSRTDAYNPPIFMIGNGNDLQQSNAFEVSYNGHSVVYDRNGSGAARAAIRGAAYMDNTVYAWGYITPIANRQELQINCDFGVDPQTRIKTASSGYQAMGHYTVVLNLTNPDGTPMRLECGSSVTATVTSPTAECKFITVSPIRWDAALNKNVFDVFIRTQRIMTVPPSPTPILTCEGDDRSFMFKVTGRPVLE